MAIEIILFFYSENKIRYFDRFMFLIMLLILKIEFHVSMFRNIY